MDQRPNRPTLRSFVEGVDRLWSRLWPIAMFGVAIVVAACGKGNGGGPGY